MIDITVLPTSSVPAYKQIAESIVAGILSGRIPPGTALPPIRSIAASLGVSVITVRTAWETLEAEGFIVTRAGSGCYAADITPEETERARLRRLEELIRELVAAAGSLGFTAEETAELLNKEFAKHK